MEYKIGEVYDFDGQKRKVIGFDGMYPITTADLEVEPEQPAVPTVDIEAIRAELTDEFERDYHSRPASPEAFKGLLTLVSLDKCNKDELCAIAAYIGREVAGVEETSKADIVTIILQD